MPLHAHLVAVLLASAALASGTCPALASPPAGSKGCEGTERLAVGDYNQRSEPKEVWEFVQSLEPIAGGNKVNRTFNVYVPPQHADGAPLPLVLDFHGTSAGAWLHGLSTRMREKGKAEGFIVVQPDSLPAWTVTADQVKSRKLNDIDFIDRLVAQLDTEQSKMCFDRNRIFATGGSAGGAMSATLACASASGQLKSFKVAAIAPVVASPGWPDMRPPIWPVCPEAGREPVPMRVIFSTNDKLIALGLFGEDLPRMNKTVREAVAAWVRGNGCTGTPTSEETGQTGYGVLAETIRYGCANVAGGRGETVLDLFGTGSLLLDGHLWPGGPGALPGEYPTTDVIWKFFDEHPR